MIPEGWKEIRIAEAGRVVTGNTPPTSDLSYYGGSIPFVAPGDLGDFKFVSTAAKTITEKGLGVSRSLPVGATLFTCIGSTIGKIGLAAVPLTTNQQINAVVPNNDHHPEFVYYQLTRVAERIAKLAGTQAVPIISKSQFAAERILSAPYNEQRRIAEILATWDRSIETVEALIANARAKKKALMQSLLTGKRRLPGFSGNWRWVKFSEVFERVRQKNDVGNTNVLTISAQHGLISQVEYFNKSIASEDVRGYTLLHRGDFAYNKSYSDGYPMGAFKPLERYDSGIVSSLYICFRLAGQEHDHGFYRHYFEAGLFNREISAIAQEGARNHGLLNVSVVDFFDTSLHAPSHNEQVAIATVINGAEQAEQALRDQLTALRQEKSALMQQLLTGKRRVKVDREGVVC
jgi:type I restriction enzyme S subunit